MGSVRCGLCVKGVLECNGESEAGDGGADYGDVEW